jgi:L,D-transpeptidase catalytic domain
VKFFSKTVAVVFLVAISFSAIAYKYYNTKLPAKKIIFGKVAPVNTSNVNAKAVFAKMYKQAASLKKIAKQSNYNTQFACLIDMSVPSSANRFFVYNFKNDSVELSGLVTHGSGKINTDTIQYSNEMGSLCTSLGKYKIGVSYTGKFGYAYKLHGLDGSNSNAFARAVVLHSHDCVPPNETGRDICKSWGCPTVAPVFLEKLKLLINASKQPVLLKIYN